MPAAVRVPEAVAYSGLSRSGIYRAHKEGRLPFRKAGRVTLILTADLDAYLGALPSGVSMAPLALKRRGRVPGKAQVDGAGHRG
jgi:excisionase family DNA binding protein